MSTISLPPIKTRIRLTRELKHSYNSSWYRYFLNESQSALHKAGCLVGKDLLLDPGTELRIEAFKAFATAEDWPDVKVIVKPEGGKDIKFYIPLIAFDGVSWELLKEPPKEPPKIITRITVEFDHHSWNDDYGIQETRMKEKGIKL